MDISVKRTANTWISMALLPDIISLTAVSAKVNKTMTITSMATVTPSIVSVKIPLDFVSLIIAIADEGDLAIDITPRRIAKAISEDDDNFGVKLNKDAA